MQPAVARLDAERGADDSRDALARLPSGREARRHPVRPARRGVSVTEEIRCRSRSVGIARRQRRSRSERIELDQRARSSSARGPGQRGERQAKAHRRVARQEEEVPAPQFPAVADPAGPALASACGSAGP